MQPKPTKAIIKGVVISLILIVFTLITAFANLQEVTWLQFVGYLIFVGGIIWSISSFAKQISYNATFGKYFVHGFAVTAVITCLMIIFMALYLSFDPSLKQLSLEKAEEAMRKNPNITEDQINQSLEISKKFFFPMVLGTTLLGYIFFGTIISLITAAVIKKNPMPIFDDATDQNLKPIE